MFRQVFRPIILGLLLVAWTVVCAAQSTTQSPVAPVTPATPTSTAAPAAPPAPESEGRVVEASETRQEFREVLRRYPPDLSRVLKLDPSLLTNESYMTTYAPVADFVRQHPEIVRNPDYYFEGVWIPEETARQTPSARMWMEILGGIGAFAFFLTSMAVLTWFVKTIVDQRRWSRLSKIQADVHTKLLDRFGSTEELLAYIKTPAGKRFLEAAPISVDATPARMNAPISRILWSLQAGLVLAMLGIGLNFVSDHVEKDVSSPLFAMAMVSLSIGVGFVLSAIVSFFVTRALGLWEVPALPAPADEQPVNLSS